MNNPSEASIVHRQNKQSRDQRVRALRGRDQRVRALRGRDQRVRALRNSGAVS